ncbi:MAG: enoyl-CoA hydratase/isomerase family protein [Proteobacteria bacterium]|nr:enoyl-CoA hydratase/isomerase family protein [Pseudomonadota bacterium]
MSKLVNYSTSDGVAVLELCNPPANAYSHEMFRQLDDAILEARMDPEVHVMVVCGAGDKFFCAGADIEMLETATPEFKYYFCLHANETLRRLEHTPKLVIAAINGHCVGGGLEVAMAADLRIARAGTAKIGLPEVSLGVLPGTGGTQRLARLIGKAKAIELMVRGDNISVQDAHQLGIVNQVADTDSDSFRAAITEIARSFCPPQKASRAVGHIKRAVQTGSELTLDAGLALERELQQQLFVSADAREGISGFTGKRSPKFTGR